MTEQQKVLDANELRAAIQREFFNDSERAIVLHVADENDRLKADLAQARAECHALSGALDASIEDYNRMKRSYEAKVEDFARETLRVSALSAENATLRAALTAAQELLELPGACVVCSAILEPREEEAPHCHDCVVTDEHEAERQDRITQLEIKIALAQASAAQASER